MLKGKRIVLGITGSIAAYKAAALTRLFVKSGAEVKIIMTPLAKEFITPVTLATLSKNTVLGEFFNHDDGEWNSHVDLGLWADLFIIAPATANTIAKMANGICDNLLLTSYLSTRAKVMLAPAMDLDMFQHPSTLRNIETVKSYGNIIIEPASGELASGLEGKGRMEDPEKILEAVVQYFSQGKQLTGKKALVTAGPTFEKIDPVRFIGNYSSGKMGYAIADELAAQGAEVTIVSGPVNVTPSVAGVTVEKVTSAAEMNELANKLFPDVDIAVMSAAVADYTPVQMEGHKIKSSGDNLTLDLAKTVDIAASLGKRKRPGQMLAGFALETENERDNALKKIQAKNLDFIVLNSMNDEGAGFMHDTNKITILNGSGEEEVFGLKPKTEVAKDIVAHIKTLL